eukprot:332085_1
MAARINAVRAQLGVNAGPTAASGAVQQVNEGGMSAHLNAARGDMAARLNVTRAQRGANAGPTAVGAAQFGTPFPVGPVGALGTSAAPFDVNLIPTAAGAVRVAGGRMYSAPFGAVGTMPGASLVAEQTTATATATRTRPQQRYPSRPGPAPMPSDETPSMPVKPSNYSSVTEDCKGKIITRRILDGLTLNDCELIECYVRNCRIRNSTVR